MSKIMHVIPSLNRGGAERFVVDLCNELAKTHHVILVSLFDNGEDSFQKEVSPDVKLITLGKKAGFDLKVFFSLFKLIRRFRPRVVNTHMNALEYLLPTILFSRTTSIFHTLHSVANKEVVNSVVLKLRGKLFSRFVQPITISKAVSESFLKYYKLVGRDIIIINGRPNLEPDSNNVEIINKKYRKGLDSRLFINVGRITEAKNQVALVRAFKEFNEQSNIKHTLLILGDVQDNSIFEELKLEISTSTDRVHLLGGCDNVVDYLGAGDCFCLTSLYEGMPISLIEAFSLGLVSLCTPVGGIVDMIDDGVNGILTDGTTIESILKGFEKYSQFSNSELIKENARINFFESYHISYSAKNYLKIYKL